MRERLVIQVRRYLMPPPISRAELKQIVDGPRAGAIVIDTLAAQDFQHSHLPGAINVPNDANFPTAILRAVADKDRRIIVYCRNSGCAGAYEAARKMELLGYTNVSVYEEGKDGWQEAMERIESPAGAPSRSPATSPPAAATDSC